MPAPIQLDTDLLRSFVAVAETTNFTRAAERLWRTQSAISLQIKRLEDMLGHRMFERGARAVRLTAEGEVLLFYARQILRLNDEAIARLVEPEVAGSVRLGTPEDFATSHLPGVLASFARAHPRVVLEVMCDLTLNLIERFAAGGFDLVLIKREPQGEGAGGIRVWREPLVWTASTRAILASDPVLPLVVSPSPCVYRKRATEALDRHGRAWRIAYTSTSLAGAQAAVRAGLGLSVLPKEMVPSDFVVLGEAEGLPELFDTEIALLVDNAKSNKPASLLAEHIVHSLERGWRITD